MKKLVRERTKMPKHRALPLFDQEDAISAEELLLRRILLAIEQPQPKRPLQCVTYKMPLPHYLRMKEAAQRWKLSYSDLLRIAMFYLTPALEAPSGELRALLETHRSSELQKQSERSLKRSLSLRKAKLAS
ncbi:hypothetical protein [Acidipila sp. EB88]|uniref:hypothetical protein n=1 Tax=Acidipila sp. EB88 TaxID=2305226 RepID=UPI000F5D8024|nr:hypothetical protein [Acidipila sp. EB88]RRA50473.1 hypothetical protein D1Y84_00215 [Acidipila sp. EB88]